jgi:hypothetical protein
MNTEGSGWDGRTDISASEQGVTYPNHERKKRTKYVG